MVADITTSQEVKADSQITGVVLSPKLTADHRNLLASKYGIPEDRITFWEDSGVVRSVDKFEATTLTGRDLAILPSGGILFTYLGSEAIVVRLDTPLVDANGKEKRKYIYPTGQPCALFNPGVDLTSSPEIWITEGVAKSMCGFDHGLPVVALGGLWNWKNHVNGNKVSDKDGLLPELSFDWTGKKAILLTDSDIIPSHPAYDAFPRLAEQLCRLGAEEVRVVALPNLTPKGQKTGLDEFIIAKGDQAVTELRASVSETSPYEPTGEGRWPKALATLRAIPEETLRDHPKEVIEHDTINTLQIVWQYNEIAVHELLEDWKEKGFKKTTLVLDLVKKVDRAKNKERRSEEEEKINPINWVIDHFKNYELWHTEDKTAYITVNGEHFKIGYTEFNNIITTTYHSETGDGISRQAREAASDTLMGYASFGETHNIYVRLAGLDGKIYLDMANEAREVIEITKDGWKIIKNPPVRFRRPDGMLPLPVPVAGGTLDDLRPFMNVTDDQWPLVKAYIIGTTNPFGTYALLVLLGPTGRMKTPMTSRIKYIIDPHTGKVDFPPKDLDDRIIIYNDNHIVGFDNESYISKERSNEYCRVSSGATLSQRKFFLQLELLNIYAHNPLIINGIKYFITEDDLLNRSIIIEPPRMTTFETQEDADKKFFNAHPKILGALLDMIVTGLMGYDSVTVNTRMADFARWVVACLGPTEGDKFLKLYEENRSTYIKSKSEGNLLVDTLVDFMDTCGEWNGTAKTLLAILNSKSVNAYTGAKSRPEGWLVDGTRLGSKLNEHEEEIRERGYVFTRGIKNKERVINISRNPGINVANTK